jgi:hypothetical protein
MMEHDGTRWNSDKERGTRAQNALKEAQMLDCSVEHFSLDLLILVCSGTALVKASTACMTKSMLLAADHRAIGHPWLLSTGEPIHCIPTACPSFRIAGAELVHALR